MATTEFEEEPAERPAAAQHWMTGAVATATDTSPHCPSGSGSADPGGAFLFAPVPANAIGVASTIALAMSQRRN
jgi:hypothetical protein